MSFEVGDQVKVICIRCKSYSKYLDSEKHYVGIVRSQHYTSKGLLNGVEIPKIYNTASSHGYFWFRDEDLRLDGEENEREVLPVFEEKYSCVKLSFEDSPYTISTGFRLYPNVEVEVGDSVVVHTAHHGFSIAKVSEIDDDYTSSIPPEREVICKVDLSSYYTRKENRAKAKTLSKEMYKRLQSLQTVAIYEKFAEVDPELKSMLDEYKSLTN